MAHAGHRFGHGVWEGRTRGPPGIVSTVMSLSVQRRVAIQLIEDGDLFYLPEECDEENACEAPSSTSGPRILSSSHSPSDPENPEGLFLGPKGSTDDQQRPISNETCRAKLTLTAGLQRPESVPEAESDVAQMLRPIPK